MSERSQAAILRNNSSEVIELLKSGLTKKEIGDRFGVSLYVVKEFTKKNGLNNQEAKNSETEAARRIFEKTDGRFEYVSGYVRKEDNVIVRCIKCGTLLERTYHHLTTSNSNACPECNKRKRAKKDAQKERERDERERTVELNKMRKGKQIRLVFCPMCGETFLSWNSRSVYCSANCRKKASNSTQGSDDRLNRSNIIDRGITLKKLYERDGGVCQICGGVCDWNDYSRNENGVFIAGNLYPSKDHIKPLSRGGKHSWENVRLAHRICNTKKFWEK